MHNTPHLAPDEQARIAHALNVIIPDMRHGCSITTTRGEILLHGRDADQVMHFVLGMYRSKQKLCVQLDGCVNCED